MTRSTYKCLVAILMAAIGLTAYSQYAVKNGMEEAKERTGRLGVTSVEGRRTVLIREMENLPGKRIPTIGKSSSYMRSPGVVMQAPGVRPGLEFYGSLVYHEQMSPGVSYPGREWSFAKFTPDGDFTAVYDCYKANGGGIYRNDKLQYVYKFIKQIPQAGPDAWIDLTYYFELDLNTGVVLGPEEIGHEFIATDVTFDETTQKAYGCFYSADLTEFQFGTVDYTNRERTTICTLPVALNAIAADSDGTLYAVDLLGNFCTIDKTTGKKSIIGATGYVPCYVTSGAIDPKTGDFYWTVSPEEGGSFLCVVDKKTGRATKILDFPYREEIAALHVLTPAAEDKAPAIATGLTANFDKGSMSGEVSFRMPDELFDGTPASGKCAYTIMVDGNIMADGEASYGEKVVKQMDLDTPGKKEFCVYTTNSTGRSPLALLTSFVGFGTPAIPEEVSARYTDGKFSISWDTVTSSFDGGYLDPSAVTYTVTAYPTGDIVAKDIKETSATYTYSVPEEFHVYYFLVQAQCNGLVSGKGTSNRMSFGTLSTPYVADFDNEDSLEGWIILDANDDRNTWRLYKGELTCYTNPMLDMDDWCISPEMHLEAGKYYMMEADVHCMSNGAGPEDFEICLGPSTDPNEFDEVVIGPERTWSTDPQHYRGYFTVRKTGLYHIGIHGISPAFTSALMIDNVKVSAPLDSSIPAAISRVNIERGLASDGADLAVITFDAPSKSLDGNPLKDLTKIEIHRVGSDMTATITDCKPGETVTYEDRLPELGNFTYEITPYNAAGAGELTSVAAQIMVYPPLIPESIQYTERDNTGYVDIEWAEVIYDVEGFPLDKADLTYDLMLSDSNGIGEVASGITETHYGYQAVPEGADQRLISYLVAGRNSAGSGAAFRGGARAIGKPYAAPWTESIPGMNPSGIIASSNLTADAQWSAICSDDLIDDIEEYDNDGGMFAMVSSEPDGKALLQFGKIDLTGLSKPTFSLAVYNLQLEGMKNENEIALEVLVDNRWGEYKVWSIDEACDGNPGWNRIDVDLSKLNLKTMQFRIVGTTVNMSVILIDDIMIADGYKTNAGVASVTAPDKMKIGKEYTVSAVVGNFGRVNMGDLSVNCYLDKQQLGTMKIPSLIPGQTENVMFKVTPNAAYPDDFKLQVEIVASGDANADDNTRCSNGISLTANSLPTVGGLTHAGTTLDWKAPVYEGVTVSDEVLETFEDYNSFEFSNLSPWTTVDADGDPTYSVSGATFDGIENGMPLSYFVMDTAAGQFNDTWAAYSGTKYLTNIGSNEDQTDDWLISPELSGVEQEVSFFARSYNPQYKETFEFLVSDKGLDLADFHLVDTRSELTEQWTRFAYTIPAGSRYFAIRCVSNGAFMFQIDDITYSPLFPVDLKLLGYNIYGGIERLNEAPVDACTFSTLGTNPGSFAVSAVYNAGESKAIRVGNSGVAAIASGIKAYGTDGAIRILGCAGERVEVYAMDGTTVFNGVSDSQTLTVAAGAGVYMVRVADKVCKVMVR